MSIQNIKIYYRELKIISIFCVSIIIYYSGEAARLRPAFSARRQPGAAARGLRSRRSNKSGGTQKMSTSLRQKRPPPICGRSISFLVIFESNVSFETVFGGLWEHSHISDSWKHSLYSERLLYVIQLHNFAFLTEQKFAFDETEACFWVTTHFGNHLHLFSEPTYPLFNT